MASCARWGAQVASNRQCLMMDSRSVLGILAGRNFVVLHVSRVGMTTGAGFRNVYGMDLGTRVIGRPNTVHAMAIDAYGDFGVPLGQTLPVHAGSVLAELIGAQRWIELSHVGPVRVALAAERGNVFAGRLPNKSRFLAHRVWTIVAGISSVATGTAQAFLRVNVLSVLVGGDLQWGIKRRMTIQARVRRIRRE